MKSLLIALALVSTAASAAELKVLEVPAAKVRGASLSTRFEVNLEDKTAGVSLTAMKTIHRGRGQHTTVKTFEKLVPELDLVGDDLVLTTADGSVVCGTMGVTRIFKRPVLNLSGNCDVITKRVGSVVEVLLVTE